MKTRESVAVKKIAKKQFEDLRSLAAELSRLDEEERKAFARELHDEICQPLALAKLRLGMLKKNLSKEEDLSALGYTVNLIEQTIRTSRSLISDISPPILYELGVFQAIEWLAERFTQQHSVKFTVFRSQEMSIVDESIRMVLFKAVRELIINVVKHAKAEKADIEILERNNNYYFIVTDQGVGFDSSRKNLITRNESGEHFGLLNIRERLEYLGGAIDIQSSVGCGTRVTLRVPCKI